MKLAWWRCPIGVSSTTGPTGGSYTVTSESLDGDSCATDYDRDMVTADYLMGFNYPASLQVRADLQSTDNRPARRQQFNALLPGVIDVETAKTVITYTDPANPLSVFGRWDLGYGETAYPKQIPDGSVDAKVGSASMVRAFMGLSGLLDTTGGDDRFLDAVWDPLCERHAVYLE